MLQPKRTKFRKQQKGRMKGNAGRGNQLAYGPFGIKSLDSNFLTSLPLMLVAQSEIHRIHKYSSSRDNTLLVFLYDALSKAAFSIYLREQNKTLHF